MTETRIIKGKISLREKCLRCGYVWFTRKESKPNVCARCRSPYWNIPKKIRKPIDVSGRLENLKKSLS